jgi:hypothetical protein
MGVSTTSGPGEAGLTGVDTEVSAVLVCFACTLCLGLEVQSKVSGQVTFVGQKMPRFPATPARFAQ